ncbi:hypothetical protein GCM10027294_22380 [Marinactinospora endophytica]
MEFGGRRGFGDGDEVSGGQSGSGSVEEVAAVHTVQHGVTLVIAATAGGAAIGVEERPGTGEYAAGGEDGVEVNGEFPRATTVTLFDLGNGVGMRMDVPGKVFV